METPTPTFSALEIVTDYVVYAKRTIAEYEELSDLIRQSDVATDKVNRALARYKPLADALAAEYVRIKTEHEAFKAEFQDWWDIAFTEARKTVIELYIREGVKAGVKPSVTEFETQARITNRIQYGVWQQKLRKAEARVELLHRLRDNLDRHVEILKTLSANMRQEMRSLPFETWVPPGSPTPRRPGN